MRLFADDYRCMYALHLVPNMRPGTERQGAALSANVCRFEVVSACE